MSGYERKPPYRSGKFVSYTGHEDTSGTIVTVHLAGDPFEICTYEHQLKAAEKESTQMPTATTKPKAKDLRRQAKALGVESWEDMSLDELIEAVAEAQEEADEAPAKSKAKSKSSSKKSTPVDDDEDEDDEDDEDDDDEDDDDEDDSDDDLDDDDTDEDDDEEDDMPVKKAAAKKSTAKKSTTKPAAKKAASKPAKASTKKKAAPARAEREVAENGNPYPPQSNLHYITELLIKGGKLGTIVKKVDNRLTINERSVSRNEEETFKEWHRRVVIVTQKLRNDFGFEMEKDGRGLDATIKMVPPAS